jgi:hypothetical protein
LYEIAAKGNAIATEALQRIGREVATACGIRLAKEGNQPTHLSRNIERTSLNS